MIERKKVIAALECCLSPNDHENCPYDGIGKTYSHCLKKLVTDALALLKEQEAKELSESCENCKEYDNEKHYCPRFCRVIRETVDDLLKEQEEGIEPKARTQEQEDFAEKLGIIAPAWWCGVCGFQLLQYGLKYCPNCGKKVKWDD